MNGKMTSALPGFYTRSLTERRAIAKAWGSLDAADIKALADSGLSAAEAELMIENVIGRYSLPFAVATNFRVNNRDILVPLVIEEASVVAACSKAAKLFRAGGGFQASSDEPIMIGQLQLLDIADLELARAQLHAQKRAILRLADEKAGSIGTRGGGARDLELRSFPTSPAGAMLILHLHFDTRDAMGANVINSALEHIAPFVESLCGGRVNLRIVSNLSDQRLARASGHIPLAALESAGASGEQVAAAILEAAIFAEIDPYRAATHNKGIMNGVDALVLATGNDWRAVEAGAHAYAARDGSYRSLTRWTRDAAGNLVGEIELPLALGIVGGATRVQRAARAALKLLELESAQELAEIAAAVGLAQNFAAMYALATDGIQSGHMRMHARQLALAAGADANIAGDIARQLIAEDAIRLERAKELIQEREQRP